ncbi:MAG: flavodoxin family protein [Christensenellales bacterium]
MNTGIILYSRSGNTLQAAQKVEGALQAAGHRVTLFRVTALNDTEPAVERIRLQSQPDIKGFDALIFCTPVHGFAPAPVMQACLAGISTLSGKTTCCLVTHFFPFAWMGGKSAIARLSATCRSKGSVPCFTGIINWSLAGSRARQIDDLARQVVAAFGKSGGKPA